MVTATAILRLRHTHLHIDSECDALTIRRDEI